MATDDTLTRKQKTLIRCLLENPSVRDAAKAAGISEATAWRYLRNDDVKQALREAETEILSEVTRSLMSVARDAVGVIRDTLTGENEETKNKLRAAEMTLSNLIRLKELSDFDHRLTALENDGGAA